MGNAASTEALDAETARENEIDTILLGVGHKIIEQKINNEIIKAIPVGLCKHSSTLESLNMNNNKIEDCRRITMLLNLRRLTLTHNCLGTLQPELFTPPKLEFLDLSYNRIPEILPEIENLKALSTFIASYNEISIIPVEIANCIALRTLILDYNKIESICLVKSLVKLDLNFNKISVIPPEIGTLTNLEYLNLSDNEIEKVPKEIGDLKQLKKLYLSNNLLNEVCPELGMLTSLQELNLSTNNLSSLPKELGNLKNLKLIDLKENLWQEPDYKTTNIQALLRFLRTKQSSSLSKSKTIKLRTKEEMRKLALEQQEKEAKSATTTSSSSSSSSSSSGTAKVTMGELKKSLLMIGGEGLNLSVIIVDPVCTSLNTNDAFIFDDLKDIYVWYGRNSSTTKRLKSKYLAGLLAKESGIPPEDIKVVDSTVKDATEQLFWKKFGPCTTPIQEPPPYWDFKNAQDFWNYELIIVEDRTKYGKPTFVSMAGKKISKRLLLSSYCAILDDTRDIWIWAGQYSSQNSKSFAMLKAEERIGLGLRPKCASIKWVNEGLEKTLFMEHFPDWTDKGWITDEEREKDDVAKANLKTVDDIGTGKVESAKKKFEEADTKGEKHTSTSASLKPVALTGTKSFSSVTSLSTTTATTSTFKKPSKETTTSAGTSQNQKRKPTRNPIRDRQAREAATAAAAEADGKDKKVEASKISGMLGGYGILYSVKADEMFSKRKESVKKDTPEEEDSNKLNPKDVPRLFHVKGRRRPFAKQVELTWKSLNSGDCFILDTGKHGKKIYQWNGKEANRIEKGKAMDLIKNIHDKERFGTTIVTIEEGKEPEEFWTVLGGSAENAKDIKSAEKGGDDEEAERTYPKYVHLYQTSLKEGSESEVELTPIGVEGIGLTKGMLGNGCCYILDCVSEVFAWTSVSRTNLKLRKATIKKTEEIVAARSKDIWIAPAYHEFAGSEQVMFKERFMDWNTVPISVGQKATYKEKKTTNPLDLKIDVSKMYQRVEEDEVMVDDGNSGKVKIFLVEEFKRTLLPSESYGEFYSGESYVVQYEYVWKNKDCHILYYWQGKKSTILGKGSSAALTIQLDDEMKKTAMMSKEIRVTEGKEPKHFLAIFKRKFIVHNGNDPRGSTHPKQDTTTNRLYHIKGDTEDHTLAIQTKLDARYLNTCNVFVAVSPSSGTAYIWNGKLSNKHERDYAEYIVSTAQKGGCTKTVTIEEGKETEEFWTAIGGKKQYPTKGLKERYIPRLFLCSVSSGAFVAEEVHHFTQEDLDINDAAILDTKYSVFVWFGTKSNQLERRLSLETAKDYTAYAIGVDGRPKDTPILRVMDFEEPLVFSTYFQGWEQKPLKKGAPPPEQTYDGGMTSVLETLEQYSRTYSYEDLVAKRYPKGLDETALEIYLSDDEFEKLFKKTKSEFDKLPQWQKQKLKKELKLY